MRALVVGGTGFIGSWIVDQLIARGDAVTILHRGRKSPDSLPKGAVSVINHDTLSTAAPFEAALRYGEPDAVIHVLALFEADAQAAVAALTGRTGRVVVLSSGDVYRAYGRFTRFEPGPPERTPLRANDSALRTQLYPYRTPTTEPGSLLHDYDKIPIEQRFRDADNLQSVILRLPKIYGIGGNADLSTVYDFAAHPRWRWTHGYVENIAAGVVLAAMHPNSRGKTYNLGEAVTPTVGERLAQLPVRRNQSSEDHPYDFSQDLDYDTEPMRSELGFAEPVAYEEGLRRTLTQRL